MTAKEQRGLQLVKDLARRAIVAGYTRVGPNGENLPPISRKLERELDEMMCAVKWISHQEGITERRRQPRGKYIGRPR